MIKKFSIKHYINEAHPVLKGNGFDGLVIGEFREEAEEFIQFINDKIFNFQNRKNKNNDKQYNINGAITVRIPDFHKTYITKQCKEMGITASEYFRYLVLQDYRKNNRKVCDG